MSNVICDVLFCLHSVYICGRLIERFPQGYAANAIKHCIRPTDMAGKSAAVILRQIHPAVYAEAQVREVGVKCTAPNFVRCACVCLCVV